jgi:transcriptional regulator with XRE-family HTH domain
MNINRIIGEKLKTLRKHRNITQEELANAIGLTYQQIQKYEKGENRISCDTLIKCAQFLNIDLFYFFSDFNTANDQQIDFNQYLKPLANNKIKNYIRLILLELSFSQGNSDEFNQKITDNK